MSVRKIPADAKKVFERELFELYEKEMDLFDGSKKTFERVRAYDVVKAICVVDGKILVLATEQPGTGIYYTIPGGMIDRGEEPDAAIVREVKEETGISFEEFLPLTSVSSNVGLVESYKHYYLARGAISFEEQQLDGGELISVEYISFEKFIEHVKRGELFYDLANWILREYVLTGKMDELKELLFGK